MRYLRPIVSQLVERFGMSSRKDREKTINIKRHHCRSKSQMLKHWMTELRWCTSHIADKNVYMSSRQAKPGSLINWLTEDILYHATAARFVCIQINGYTHARSLTCLLTLYIQLIKLEEKKSELFNLYALECVWVCLFLFFYLQCGN